MEVTRLIVASIETIPMAMRIGINPPFVAHRVESIGFTFISSADLMIKITREARTSCFMPTRGRSRRWRLVSLSEASFMARSLTPIGQRILVLRSAIYGVTNDIFSHGESLFVGEGG